MKKLILALTTVLFLLSAGAASAGTAEKVITLVVGDVRAQVDGQDVTMPAPAVIVDERSLVPLRFVGGAFGCDVQWNDASRTATVRLAGHIIEVPIGKSTAVINGLEAPVQVPARIIDGRTYVPLRFVGESLGARVDFDPATYKITIAMQSYMNEEAGFKMVLPPGWVVDREEKDKVDIKVQGQGHCIVSLADSARGTGRDGFPQFADEWLKGYETREKLLQVKNDETAGVIFKEGGSYQIHSIKPLGKGVFKVEASYPEMAAYITLAREYEIVLKTLRDISG